MIFIYTNAYAGTTFVGFTRDLAPGIRVLRGATAVLDSVTFRGIELLPKSKGTVIEATAVAAYRDAVLGLVVCYPGAHTSIASCFASTLGEMRATPAIYVHIYTPASQALIGCVLRAACCDAPHRPAHHILWEHADEAWTIAHTLPGWNAPTGLAGAWPRSGWCTDQPFLLFVQHPAAA